MDICDIDLFEVNEAFASVVLRFMQAFDVDHGKVNVNGGSIAMGHPLGATGAMIIGTLLDELERRTRKRVWPRSASRPAWAPPPSSSGSDAQAGSTQIPIKDGSIYPGQLARLFGAVSHTAGRCGRLDAVRRQHRAAGTRCAVIAATLAHASGRVRHGDQARPAPGEDQGDT